MMKWGAKTSLATAQAEGVSGGWVSVEQFVGTDGRCTIKGWGTFGGTTVTIQEADDSAGTGAATITSASFTAAFTEVFDLARENFVRVVTTGGAGASITVKASPHSKAG